MSSDGAIGPELLIAYADGELNAVEAKRVERAVAADPALSAQLDEHRALRASIAGHFAPVADEPVPERLAAMLTGVATLPPQRRRVPAWTGWGGAVAASLFLGLMLGHSWDAGMVRSAEGRLYAAGPLAHALDDQLAATGGAVRVPVSFRDAGGAYCRVFTAPATDGIACRDGEGWALRQTRGAPDGAMPKTDYVQAGSADPALMAAAQGMMAGEPLDAAAEARARAAGWR